MTAIKTYSPTLLKEEHIPLLQNFEMVTFLFLTSCGIIHFFDDT